MPAFVKMNEEEMLIAFKKFVEERTLLTSSSVMEFFTNYGMMPRREEIVINLLKKIFAEKTFVEMAAGFIPEAIGPTSFNGFCYYSEKDHIAYFTELNDMFYFKLLADKQIEKIII